MILFLLIITAVALADMKAAKPGEFFDTYMSKESTTAVNGIFVLLIFLSHCTGYIKTDGVFDAPYLTFKNNMLQLVVVSFLFYSGYGIAQSVRTKGPAYIRSIPTRRFFKVYYRLFLCVCLFIAVNFIIGKDYGLKRTLLAFTGWTGIGNSNWYIFVILVLYLIVFVSFSVFRKKLWAGMILTTLLSAALVIVQIKLDRSPWTYNTVMLFPTGMIFSFIREPFEKIVRRSDSFWFLAVGAFSGVFFYLHYFGPKNIAAYSLWAICFMMLLVLLTMKLQLKNPILSWFGSHVFSVYMLQRIPMILLKHYGFAETNKYAFVAVSFAATVLLSHFFESFTEKTDNLIFKKAKP